MSILSSLMLITLSIVCIFPTNTEQLENDRMCGMIHGILCMSDELKMIATVAQAITHKLDEIEDTIQNKSGSKRFNMNVNTEIHFTRPYVPVLYYHKKTSEINNVNKEYLIQLLIESHDSMIFYHHSINDLLSDDIHAQEIGDSFKTIQDNIRTGMICRYRNLLDVYSQQWKSSEHIDRLRFSPSRLCPSCAYNVYSIVTIRYLREWMVNIHNVIDNLGKKFM